MRATNLLAADCLVLAGCVAAEDKRAEDAPAPLRVTSDTVVKGFTFPESVGCDRADGVIYVSNFGGTQLKPGEKDGKGYVSKLTVEGKMLEERAFPVTMNKPKGIFVDGRRLWVTDIDGVWIFDTLNKKGRKLMIPGARFANDVTARNNILYVSDNRGDTLYRIEPSDFLDARVQPKITESWAMKEINPNGLWVGADGWLLIVGFLAPDKPRGVYAMDEDGKLKALGAPVGRLDGIAQLRDGSILVTDWNTGTLARWTEKGGLRPIARDFKGPADFCVLGHTAFVPDLVKNEVRIIELEH